MLNKYKMLMLMIVLTIGGIVVVLCTWLYGSYVNRREVFVSEVERSLFNVVQSYYHEHEDDIRESRIQLFKQNEDSLVDRIQVSFPDVDRNVLAAVMDSVGKERSKYFGKRRGTPRAEEPSQIVPSFMLQSIAFDPATLDEMNGMMKEVLSSKQISTDIQIQLVKLDSVPGNGISGLIQRNKDGDLITRPVLVNPNRSEFLLAEIGDYHPYVMLQMIWQFILTLALILALTGSFIYLLWTINKQSQMALLHKTFVNNMTHELKTPVATVMAAVEAIQRYGAKDDKIRMEKYLDLSRKELEHLSKMIERVLEFYMHGEKGLSLQLERFDLVLLVHNCVETSKIVLQKEVSFTVTSAQSTVMLHADQSHIKNMITNLIDNALKYSGDPVSICIEVEDHPSEVIFSITDNGVGIDKTHHGDVFDMFFRVPTGNLYSAKGFGLGLAYVKQIVEQHSGTIAVQSALGKGSKFKIVLPKRNS